MSTSIDFILYMRVVNMDAASCLQKMPEKSLGVSERDKKRKYLDSCLQQRHHFSPFVVSINGILGTEAEAKLKCLDSRLTIK